jgi:hypothetical protein
LKTRFAFLLGAGASKAVGADVKPRTPPLMRDLYDELARDFPKQWGPGSPLENYRDRFNADFEQTYTEIVLQTTSEYALPGPSLLLLEGPQRILASYFSRFVLGPSGTDYYSKLLEAFRRSGNLPQTVFGSLNYECLFEQAAENLSLHVNYDGPDFRADTVHVSKLHGSCNFIAYIDQTAKALLAGTMTSLEAGFDIFPPRNVDKILAENFARPMDCYLPVMSLVSHYKFLPLGPMRIQQMRNSWNAGTQHAEYIPIVGVSFNRYDHHIIEQIENAPGRVLYVGGKGDFDKWHAISKRAEHIAEKLENGFDDLLTRLGVV